MLTVENVSLQFDKQILFDISFRINGNEIVGIAGQSGAGKTSLLKIIGGLLDATEGTIHLDGKRVVGPALRLIPGHPEIQLVNQDFALDLYQTVQENIKGKILHLPKTLQQEFSEELLDLLELQHTKDRQAITLSGGEQQRLAIARAMAMEPKILLLDEPFVHLDLQLRFKLINYLIDLKTARKMGIAIVSHNSEELLSLCDKIVYITQGKVRRIATPKSFYYHYKSLTEGRSFGIINSLQIGTKKLQFRPDEYDICSNSDEGIEVKFSHSIFMGSYYLNEFIVENNKKIILLNKEPLQYVRTISIKKKGKNS